MGEPTYPLPGKMHIRVRTWHSKRKKSDLSCFTVTYGGYHKYVGSYDLEATAREAAEIYRTTGVVLEGRKRGLPPINGRKPRIFKHFVSGRDKEHPRTVYDASMRETSETGVKTVGLGRHPSKEEAQAAIDLYLATGEIHLDPAHQKPDPNAPRFVARIQPRKLKCGTRYDVRGKDREQKGNGYSVHVGAFMSEPLAREWKARFEADGSKATAPGRNLNRPKGPQGPRASRAEKPPLPPLPPPLPKANPRAQRPGESRAAWMKRLFYDPNPQLRAA